MFWCFLIHFGLFGPFDFIVLLFFTSFWCSLPYASIYPLQIYRYTRIVDESGYNLTILILPTGHRLPLMHGLLLMNLISFLTIQSSEFLVNFVVSVLANYLLEKWFICGSKMLWDFYSKIELQKLLGNSVSSFGWFVLLMLKVILKKGVDGWFELILCEFALKISEDTIKPIWFEMNQVSWTMNLPFGDALLLFNGSWFLFVLLIFFQNFGANIMIFSLRYILISLGIYFFTISWSGRYQVKF